MSAEVTATNIIRAKIGYRFITGLWGRQILQVADLCQNWDTNSGIDSGSPFTSWRNATRWEAEALLREVPR